MARENEFLFLDLRIQTDAVTGLGLWFGGFGRLSNVGFDNALLDSDISFPFFHGYGVKSSTSGGGTLRRFDFEIRRLDDFFVDEGADGSFGDTDESLLLFAGDELKFIERNRAIRGDANGGTREGFENGNSVCTGSNGRANRNQLAFLDRFERGATSGGGFDFADNQMSGCIDCRSEKGGDRTSDKEEDDVREFSHDGSISELNEKGKPRFILFRVTNDGSADLTD